MQIKRILLIPFILLATVVLLTIIAILFGVGATIICLTEVFSSTYNWAFKKEYADKGWWDAQPEDPRRNC